jgi:hypothetical protein
VLSYHLCMQSRALGKRKYWMASSKTPSAGGHHYPKFKHANGLRKLIPISFVHHILQVQISIDLKITNTKHKKDSYV